MNMRQRRILNALALLVVAFLATALPALAASIDGGASIRSAPVTRGGDRVFDLSAGLQEGVTFTPLASGVTNDLVEDPFCAVDEELGSCVAPRLLLERIPLAPGESIGDPDRLPLYDHMSAHGPELLYVEAGEVVMATSSDQSFGQYTQEDAYAAGDQVALPMQEYVLPNGDRSLSSGGGYELRNDSSEPACVLRLSLGEWQTYGGGFASDVSGAAIPSCREYRTLAVGFDTEWVVAPATLFIAQLTLEPGSSLGPNAYSGPVALATDAGTLGLSVSDGATDDLYRDDEGVVIPAGRPYELRVRGDESAVAIMAGVVPSEQELDAPVDSETGLLAPSAEIPRAEPAVDGNSYTGPTYGYTLTWDDTWEVAGLSTASMHNLLELSNGISRVSLTSYDAFEGDAGLCLEAATERLTESSADLDQSVEVMQDADGVPIEGDDGERAYRQLISDGEFVDDVFYVECRTLVPDKAVLEIRVEVSYDDLDSQVQPVAELLDRLTLP